MSTKVFPRNEHVIDRLLRVVVGAGLLVVAITGPKIAWGYLGILPLLTGLAGFCPGYKIFGITTCHDDT
ncbi:MAG: DUF2892 domain-containing protein [Gemmatimonadota bacterium]|nr:MAG: DUF2892 domain-containing protein [Gemmatimonadota bacterium]